jgi:trehalose 6-phosphate phosphatase
MARPPAPPPHAIARAVSQLGRPLLLAFDVDGTLAPIVSEPASARVPPGTRALLLQLAQAPGVHVALVTGRDLGGLVTVAGSLPVWRAVSHGRVVLSPADTAAPEPPPTAALERLEGFRAWAQDHAVPEGAVLEDKDGAVAVHVRELAAGDPSRAEALLERARASAEHIGLHARLGRAVCEAEVEAGDKGTALRQLIAATRARGVLYAGDDLTDLPAIALAVDQGGMGLFVTSTERPAPDCATAALEGTGEVDALLAALVGELSEDDGEDEPRDGKVDQ